MTKPRKPLLGHLASPDLDGLPAEVRQHVANEVATLVQAAHEFAVKRRAEHISAGMDADAVDVATRDMYDLAALWRHRAQQWRGSR